MRRGGYQPYRLHSRRRDTAALTAMQRGRPATLRNPMDARRAILRKRKKKRRAKLPARKPVARVMRVRQSLRAR